MYAIEGKNKPTIFRKILILACEVEWSRTCYGKIFDIFSAIAKFSFL